MSAALERVIAEQQKEIDDWKARDLTHIEVWQRHHKRLDDLMRAVFVYMYEPTTPQYKQSLIAAIRDIGYCVTCEASPCECESQYD